jgi:transcription elongation factor Elf1
MSIYIDHKFVGLVSPRLERFSRKDSNLYNFRCPICGDSHRNKSKARGYVYERKGGLYFRCHNCGSSMGIGNFIKTMDPEMYKEYVLEKYKDGSTGHGRVSEKKDPKTLFDFSAPKFSNKPQNIEGLRRIDTIPAEHKAVRYLSARKIPEAKYKSLYYTENFKEWVTSLSPKYDNLPDNEERIVIPYYDDKGNLFAAQGRSLDAKNKLRYITVRFDEDTPKVYGLNTWDKSKNTIIVEGPIDSLFLENCVAMGGADIPFDLFDRDKTVFVFDNEPRNKEIVDRIGKVIEKGYSVCFFPDAIEEKDINDMVLAGATSEQLMKIIEKNTFSGLSATAKFTNWKRI